MPEPFKISAIPYIKAKSMWRVIVSVIAAAFGVQSQKNLEQDNRSQSILPYVLAGVIFTVIFIATLITIVNLVLN